MKKLIAIAVVTALMLTTLTAGVAYAGSAYSNARADFAVPPGRYDVPNAWGHAIINYAKGEQVWQVNGSVHNLLPDTVYNVEIGQEDVLGGLTAVVFTTDGKGKANFHNNALAGVPAEYTIVRIVEGSAPSDVGSYLRIKLVARQDGKWGSSLQFRGTERGQ